MELDEYRSGKWKDLIYKGSSPDEEAFVKFTLRNGFVFSSRVRDEVTVTVKLILTILIRILLFCCTTWNTRARVPR